MQYCLSCFLVKTKNQFCSQCAQKLFFNSQITNINIDDHNNNIYSYKDNPIINKNIFFNSGTHYKSLLVLNNNELDFKINNQYHFLIKDDKNSQNIKENITQQILNHIYEDNESVAQSFILQDNLDENDKKYYYVTKLFTHNKKGNLYKEFKSISQLLEENQYDEYDIDEIDSYEEIFEFLNEQNYFEYPEVEKIKLLKMLICDYILGNDDRHFNNFGILFDLKKKKGRLAPIFDTNSTNYNKNYFSLLCNILKNSNNGSKKILDQFYQLSELINFKEEDFSNYLNHISSKLNIILKIVENSPLNNELKKEYIEMISYQCKNLLIDTSELEKSKYLNYDNIEIIEK